MPLNRRMLAADQELASQLSQLAHKNNTSLYSLTNRLIKAYIILEKIGYLDPVDAAIDLLFFSNIFNTGFKIQPPQLTNNESWEKLGESLWLVISIKNPDIDPRNAIVRLASILTDKKNVFIDYQKETRIMITTPIDSKLSSKELYELFKGFIKEAIKNAEYDIQWKSNVIIIKIKEPEKQ